MNSPEPAIPVVTKRRSISVVWIVPLIAVAIGVWLLVHTLNQKGPTIEIQFESAEGLEAGKTKIKLRDVVIGVVSNIALGENPSYVIVTAEIQKDAARFIRSDTAFWVVRPRIQGASVSGLGTLVSGAYISILPGESEQLETKFVALAAPPLIEDEESGKHFILEADRRGSLTPGSPVYLRDLQVGEVTSINLVENNRYMEIGIFIRDPYDETVLSTTRFWNASGVEFSIGAEGVDVQVASLETLLSGGIAFETLDGNGRIPPENARYRLYASRSQIDEFSFKEKIRYVLYFDDSVRGLSVDAPVEFRGIKIGSVTSINAEFDPSDATVRIPVVIEIQPERIDRLFNRSPDEKFERQSFKSLVDLGLRGQLQTGSLLTGKLFVALDFYPESEMRLVGVEAEFPEIPTIPTVLGKFEDSATAILNKLEKIPLDQLSENLVDVTAALKNVLQDPAIHDTLVASKKTMENLGHAVEKLDQQIMPKMADSLASYDSSSEAYRQLVRTLEELQSAADALRELANELERAPEALIRGKR